MTAMFCKYYTEILVKYLVTLVYFCVKYDQAFQGIYIAETC